MMNRIKIRLIILTVYDDDNTTQEQNPSLTVSPAGPGGFSHKERCFTHRKEEGTGSKKEGIDIELC